MGSSERERCESPSTGGLWKGSVAGVSSLAGCQTLELFDPQH